ncbi:hypothetical protein GA830_15145 [Mesorhizobium sp. NBSH29]|uniref:hypothetical protein n=1 Tax=Mesorhizobium sp. NBSH29 TaxID=2654249 RepID=UPI001896A46A|nr:hypothetical protein [Mesorhizobium sp. NBSH29]QPC87935.1 hypothetical protein GA830_15145 [Mesorhizobium sp. NBSH29]
MAAQLPDAIRRLCEILKHCATGTVFAGHFWGGNEGGGTEKEQRRFIKTKQQDETTCKTGTKQVHRNEDKGLAGLIDDLGVMYHGSEFIAACRG